MIQFCKIEENISKKKKIRLCEEGCEYEGEDLKQLRLICYCPIKVNTSEGYLKNIENEIYNYISNHNFKVLFCYKLTFSYKGQKKNYFSEIFIFIFLINITIIIINEKYYKKNLEDLINYCKKFINNNNNDRTFKELKNLDLVELNNRIQTQNLTNKYYLCLISAYIKKEIKKIFNRGRIKRLFRI